MHKVLVVEDDEDVREVVRESLEEAGYWVVCAANGREAIEMLRAESEPCLVLLDLIMPVSSGWQFRAAQLEDPVLSRFPVVVMTATSTLEEAAVNADALLQKPVKLQQLLQTVARFCTPADFAEAERTERFSPGQPLATDESGPTS